MLPASATYGDDALLGRRLGEPFLARPAELGHWDDVAGERKGAVLDEDTPVFGRDFQPICAGSFTRRGNERGMHAGRVFEVRRHIVFHFDIVIASELAKTADT